MNASKKWFTTVAYYDADGTQLKLLRKQLHLYKVKKNTDMQTHIQEQSQSNTSSQNDQNNSNSSENYNERIEGTPLMVIKQMNETWLLVFGMYKLKEFETKEEAKEYVKENMLNIVVDMISIVVEFHNNQKQQPNE